MLSDEQKAALEERAVEKAQGSFSLIKEKLPEASLIVSGDRLGLKTNFMGREVGVTHFDLTKLIDEDYVRRVVMSWEGKVNGLEAEFVTREAIKKAILELV